MARHRATRTVGRRLGAHRAGPWVPRTTSRRTASPALVTLGTLAVGLAATGAVAIPGPGSATRGATAPVRSTVTVRPAHSQADLARTSPLSRSASRTPTSDEPDPAPAARTRTDAVPAPPAQPTRTTTRAADRREAALRTVDHRAATVARALRDDQWVLPLTSYRLTAQFGQSSYLWSTVHTGLDLAAPTGTRVGGVAGGTVTSAGYVGSYGNRVILTQDDGTETWYAHMDTVSVSVGDRVAAGDQLGTVGATGNVTGPHLHLEVRPGAGAPVDPVAALAQHGLDV